MISAERGSSLILVLIFLSVFILITTAWTAFSVRVYQQSVRQAQHERIFRGAEAGIAAVLYRLNVADETPGEVVANPPSGTLVLTDAADASITTMEQYDVSFPEGAAEPLTAMSNGQESGSSSCEIVTAVIEERQPALSDGPTWAVTESRHTLYGGC
ncbi:MAG: hypothetical protein COT71_02970 [Candidatus Andersenbacteria bacterium CG10_big_fil_rev_8_21_14_0_10_54_11]|uniref:Type 4 fimbrial biogenesis protein PilX N-terminal domain-containing protein n=1 Tax=Candidatus Andersenbacteria bacterium CG10_big_fil_rev_8_21_14_0_10_54_11 TaxID=1974485 RepID=A0A2M6WZ12_9BACT|nr:MAG: hypothetical protein COT71_02970 [Candidatus Andersenbacteria bacterium CG10_big_fil_rev_8_21_14_0_10_54_11]